MSKKVAVLRLDDKFRAESQQLAEQLSVVLLDQPDDATFDFYCVITEERCELHSAKHQGMAPFYIDFLHGKVEYRCRKGGGRRQPLARAIGLRAGYCPAVLDLTAGLGRDGWILANLGCPVTLIERSPVVAALLQDGLRRARSVKPLSIECMVMEAADYLRSVSVVPEVIYLDPMFPSKPKVALVKKEMQILQQIVTEPDDGKELFALAKQSGCRRLVVKRPQWAEALNQEKPDAVVATKRYRFDIYLSNTTKIM
jgi:16S rRNA (guanine1516-N2)-methyltransferase